MKQNKFGFVFNVCWVAVLFTALLSNALFADGFNSNKINSSETKSDNPLILILTFNPSNYNGFNVSCNGGSNGAIDLTPSNGTAPYTYIWSTGSVDEDLTGLTAGTYTVTVTDFLGDTQTGSVTLTEPTALAINLDIIEVDSCGGVGDGAISISVTGGVLNYGYVWSNASITEDITGLVANTYTVTVTDANACTATKPFVVGEVPSLILSTSTVDVLCNGQATGSIDLIVLGGTPVYVYNWSNGAGSQDISGLVANTYTVTVTDGSACTVTTSAVINQPAAALGLSTSATAVSCFGGNNGSIDLTVTGGTPNYTYLWSNGFTGQDPSALTAGTYTVTVTDANSCTATTSATVTQPAAALGLSRTATDVSCFGGNNGSIDLTVTGGTPNYTYLWSSGFTGQDPSALTAGTYTVTVTDANNCTATASAVVNQPAAALGLSTSATAVSCFGGNNGSIDLTVTGGTPNYTYLWSNGFTGQNPSALTAGTYTVTVTDANSCTATTSATITQPAAALGLSSSATDVSCFGGNNGSIDLTVTGGTPNYTYLWSNGFTGQDPSALTAGTYTVTVTDANSCTATTSAIVTQPAAALGLSTAATSVSCFGGNNGSIDLTVTGGTPNYTYLWSSGFTGQDPSALTAGTYTVTVTDANSCTATTSATITQPAAALGLSSSATDVSCFGGNNGSIDLTVTGGTPNYTYLWSSGFTGQDPSALTAGTYTVTVTDANSCTATTSANVTQPAATIGLSTSTIAVSCFSGNNGSINLTVTGGTPNYTYLWSNGFTGQDPSALITGTYTVTVTDANSCTATTSATVTQNAIITATFFPVNGTCNASNGSVTVVAGGGVPGYTYLWNTGSSSQAISGLAAGTYTVTITDNLLCTRSFSVAVGNSGSPQSSLVTSTSVSCFGGSNGSLDITVTGGTPNYTYLWNTGATSQDISSLTAGTYTVTVTDQNFCVNTNSFVVSQPSIISLSATPSNVLCNGGATGSINLTVSGGTPNYSYLWSNGATNQDPSGLIAGTYTVTVTDDNSCTRSQSFVVTQPSALTATTSTTSSGCGVSTGSATVNPAGGTPNYSYLWNTGGITQTINLISAGLYTVTVTDDNGCTVVENVTVISTNAPVISNVVNTPVTCFGGSNGSLDITVTGGTPTYTYVWSTGASSQDISGLTAGTYTVTVTDFNSCSVSASYIVTQATLVSGTAVLNSPTCNGFANGSIDLTPSGGNGVYTYLWNTSAITQDISGVAAGTYTVIITDGNLCTGTTSFVLTQPNLITSSVNVTQPLCNGGADGSIDLTVNGGTPTYTYLWSNGFSGQDLIGITAGTYTVTITDLNSCTRQRNVIVGQPAAITSSVTTTPTTCGSSNGTASVSASGGTGTLTYLWNTGSTSTLITGLAAATFTVTITDNNACTVQNTGTVSAASLPVISNSVVNNVSCNGGSNGAISITVSGGAPNYSFLWSNGATTQNINSLVAGNYTVTVTDQNSCSVSGSFTVTQPGLLQGTFNNVSATCGLSNGSSTVTPVGGVPGYSFLWSNGATTAANSSIPAGTYTVTITDFNLCTRSLSTVVTGANSPIIDSAQITHVLCHGDSNGAITVFASGGTGTLNYSWSNGGTSSTINNLVNGNYTVTITDAAACSITQTYAVNQPNVLLTPVTTQPSFCGQASGQATVNPNGGTPPYSYLWSNGQTTQTITNLTAGTYTVTVTDFNGCTRRRNAVVQLANGPVITLINQVNVLCNGGTTGSIDISVTGGILPYSYSWSNGSTSQDVAGLAAGTYTVIVTDSTLCSDSLSFIITESSPFSVSSVITNASCGIANGSIALTVGGSTPGYTYLWSTGSTNDTLLNVSGGTYTVTVSDLNLCDTVLTYTVGTLSGPSIAIDSIRNVRCFGAGTGRIYLTITGGTLPYSILWNDGNTNEDRLGLLAGTYTVTVTDFGGCSAQLSMTVNQNPQITASFTTQQATCNQANGSATVIPGGGAPSYVLLWETGATSATITNLLAGTYSVTITDNQNCTYVDSVTITNSGAPVVQLQNQTLPKCFGGNDGSLTITITSGQTPYTILWSNGDTGLIADTLAAGTHTVTVTDALGCTGTQSFLLSQPAEIVLQTLSTPSYCGQINGSATVVASGGTGQLSYLWSNSAITAAIISLASGTYTVTVTDQNLCTASSSVAVAAIGPPVATVNQVVDVGCFGAATGSITVAIAGGTGSLSFLWSSGQTTRNIFGLTAGTYTLVVTDSAGCLDTLTVNVNEPPQLTITPTVNDASCGSSNGSISIVVNGGVPNYQYLWSNGVTNDTIQNITAGTYTVTVTDFNLCTLQQTIIVNDLNGPVVSLVSMTPVTCPTSSDGAIDIDVLFGSFPFNYLWSNGATTQDITNVPAGIYLLTVTDDNGCITTFTDTVTAPSFIQVAFTVTLPSCGLANGNIVASASGGTPNYSYLWSNGNGSSNITSINTGTYTVTVIDDASCTFDTSISITNTGIPAITLISIDSVDCNGGANGTIDFDVTGGVFPYLYTWINTSQTTQDVDSLTAGTYTVIVTDDEGCTSTQTYTVSQPSPLQISFPVLQNAACGQSNGFVSVATSGGVPGYSYLWSNASVADTIFNLVAGSYTVTVTDFKGCTASSNANISNLTGPAIVSTNSVDVSCNGGSDGSISVTASGVSLPLSYSWSNLPDTVPSLSGLTAGSYTLTVTDAAGCVAITTVTIAEPGPFVVNASIPQKNPPYNISCFGLRDGELFLSVTGGTAPYSYVWSNGAITQNLLNLAANVYTVFITDDKNCTTSRIYTLTEPPQLVANAGSDFIVCGQSIAVLAANNPGIGIGFWQVVSSDSVLVFSDSASATSTISNLAVGDNILSWTVSDGICSSTDQVNVVSATEIAAIGGIDRKVCGDEVNLNATRPEFGYGYWTPLSPGTSITDSLKAFTLVTGLSYGPNTFLWTVVNGTCRDSVVVTITRRDTLDCLPRIQLPTAFSPNFDGNNDYLVIKGLEEYPDNEIVIYNRWGQVVFSQNNYRNDWYGINENGEPLVDGTYFVIVKARYINKIYNSYIDLRR
jgi:gliding motility-associated-like protein